MSMQVVPVTVALVHTDDVLPTIDSLIADAVAACVRARASGITLQRHAEQTLRAIREAGRWLSLVQRSDGGRPRRNSSHGMTSYQDALVQAGISRETANRWRRVADIADVEFERFIVDTKLTEGDLTVAALLRACRPKADTEAGHAVKLCLSAAEYPRFQHLVDVLGAACGTDTVTQTVLAVLAHAYDGLLAAQIGRPAGNGRAHVV